MKPIDLQELRVGFGKHVAHHALRSSAVKSLNRFSRTTGLVRSVDVRASRRRSIVWHLPSIGPTTTHPAVDQRRPRRIGDFGNGRSIDGQSCSTCTDHHHGRATRNGSVLATNRSAHPAGQTQPARHHFCRDFRARHADAPRSANRKRGSGPRRRCDPGLRARHHQHHGACLVCESHRTLSESISAD